jgi:anti-sigma regulatory factor (Ser/Thr protein kinase)
MALLPHEATTVSVSRRSLARELRDCGVDRLALDDALIVLSELVSNAVRHADPLGAGQIQVGWEMGAETLEIAVTDGGSASDPVADTAAMTAVGGRGLDIVRRLSVDWGVRAEDGQVTVWAAVPVPGAAPAAR